MRVGERVVHADVGQTADEDQRRRPQPAQHDLEIRSDETRVAPLDDVKLVRQRPQRRLEVGARLAFDAVHAFAAVQFTTEVNPAGPVHLLEEHHRHAGGARRRNQFPGPLDTLGMPGHVGNTHLCHGHSAALLDVDDNQHGVAHDEWLCWHLTSSYRYSWIGRGLQ